MTSMVAEASSGTTSQLLPTLPVKEKGSKNKRKYRADPPLVDPNKIGTLLPNEYSSFEFSTEKFELTCNHEDPCDCNMYSSSDDHSDNLKLNLGLPTLGQSTEETKASDGAHGANWSDLTESQLEELVLNNLEMIIKGAIKHVADSGHSEEVATNAVLRSGLCHVLKVTASSIGENAINFLKNGQGNDKEQCFEDLNEMAKYILAGMVTVLREVRPLFSTGDAMWCLLVSDLSLSHACATDFDICVSVAPDCKTSKNNSDLGSSAIPCGNTGANSTNSAQVQLVQETKASKVELPVPSKPNHLTRCAHTCQCERAAVSWGPNSPKSKSSFDIGGPYLDKETSASVGKTQSHGREEKFGASKKVSGITKKEYILRQKSFHFEKSFRTYSCRGFSRSAKMNAFGGLVLDKKAKAPADSSCVSIKNVSLKISKSMGVDVPCDRKTHNLLTKVGFPSPLDLEGSNIISSLSKTNVPSTPKVADAPDLSTADTELSLSLPTNVEAPNPSVGPTAPFEKKDEMIMKLFPEVRKMENELKEWTEWANQKIMQAARRLGKDKAELKMLRQEKEEVERLKGEKQQFEENTVKSISEMENALVKASGQFAGTNASLRRLEGENRTLRQGLEDAKLRAAESAAKFNEVSKREAKTMVQFQSWEKQKSLLQEELGAEKQKWALLQQQTDRAMDLSNKVEARLKVEENAKEELLKQAASIGKQRQQIEASSKSKEEVASSKAKSSLQKYKEGIEKLRREISQLRLKSESSKIDALRRGGDGSYVGKSADCKSSKTPMKVKENAVCGGLKRERECVMCLSEEMSVVFLPCAHQVVCKTCNDMHEKQGMKDCPSCRTPIQRRICVQYARP